MPNWGCTSGSQKPNSASRLAMILGFFPSSIVQNRKCLSPWGCFCSRTINSICGLLQLHVLKIKNVHLGFCRLAPREQVSSFRICPGSGCPQLMWFHRDLRAFHSVGFFTLCKYFTCFLNYSFIKWLGKEEESLLIKCVKT